MWAAATQQIIVTFLTAEWRRLLMLNYVVAPDVLEPHVPLGTDLDEWNGRTYLSLVGFCFLDTRIRGWRVPWHQRFCEVNLRFYVRNRNGRETHRGVVFLREIVPKRAVATVAKTLYEEPYVTARMKYDSQTCREDISLGMHVAYSWRHANAWSTVSATVSGPPVPLVKGSEAEFITEHYWGYTRRQRGTAEYQVQHEPWRVADAANARLEGNVGNLFGTRLGACLSGPPASAFVADGSPVTVSAGAWIA